MRMLDFGMGVGRGCSVTCGVVLGAENVNARVELGVGVDIGYELSRILES